VITGVHHTSQSLIDVLLFIVAFKAITEEMRVFLVGLVGKPSHLVLLSVWLTRLSCINVLLILHVFEANRVLRLVYKLRIHLVGMMCLRSPLSLVYVHSALRRLL